MRSQLPEITKQSVGGFEDINIEEDDLSQLQEELKESHNVGKAIKTSISEEDNMAIDKEKKR